MTGFNMVIIADTREQRPYTFRAWPVELRRECLPVGDYSLPGFEDRIAIERKTLPDLIACLKGSDRTRFEKELARARSYEFFAVVVEANLFQVSCKQYHSAMSPHAVIQTISAFHIRYGIPFLFCGDRAGAEYMTISFLQKHLYEVEKRFKQSQKIRTKVAS